jgi:ubiquinone biosynthesis protein UbiJ
MESSKLQLVPMALLSAFVTKLMFSSPSLSEMGVVFALSSGLIAFEYLSKSKRVEKMEQELKTSQDFIEKKITEQNSIITKQNEVIKSMALEFDQVRGNISSLKMATGMKKVGG